MFRKRKLDPIVSILVPFKGTSRSRRRIWKWLKKFYSHHFELDLRMAEIVVGKDRHGFRKPFSKTAAVNDAAQRANGKIFVILDADTVIDPEVIWECVARIGQAAANGYNLWFVPYRRLFRLTEAATKIALAEDPHEPFIFTDPISHYWVESTEGSAHGSHFGAMCQVMPRKAFFSVGGMDERFRGWGSEDVSFVRAVDTLWGRHKTTDNQILHLRHDRIGETHKDRKWRGQEKARVNEHLGLRYHKADKQVEVMRELVQEWWDK